MHRHQDRAVPKHELARRLAKISELGVLGTPPEPAFDEVVALAATICETPMAAISIVGESRQWLKARVGLAVSEMPIADSFCRHTIRGKGPLEIRDARRMRPFSRMAPVRSKPGMRFYMGVPLRSSDGVVFGALCVLDTAPRLSGLTAEQTRALEMLARQTMLQLELRQAIAERDRRAAEQRESLHRLEWLATHDPLTGLGNRALLHKALTRLVNPGGDATGALLVIDVDWLKQVNDAYGHHVGDALLKELAKRVETAASSDRVAIRSGGDEFALLVPDIKGDALRPFADTLLEAMRRPCMIDGQVIRPSVTVGSALYPEHTSDADELLRLADIALYCAKVAGRDRHALFEAGMLDARSQRLEQLAAARHALEHDLIRPYYQPKLDLLDGHVVGLEALLRIIGSDGGARLPATIAAAFEDASLAGRLSERMIDRTLRDIRLWLGRGIDFGRVAINVSGLELADGGFASRLLDKLAAERVRPDYLEIEILETAVLDRGSDVVLSNLRQLAGAGVRIALDDFGTGYAALAHLPRFPVEAVKIDRTFVQGLEDRANAAVVRAIVGLANELGIETVAEGVETKDQALRLLEMGCGIGQGFLYSDAVPAANIEQALKATPLTACPQVLRGRILRQLMGNEAA